MLIGGFRFGFFSGQQESAAQLHADDGSDGIGEKDAGVIEELLKFSGCFGSVLGLEVGETADVNGIEVSEETEPASRCP